MSPLRIFRRRDLACRQVVTLLTDYLEGALDARQQRRLERHLAACPHCTEFLRQLRATIDLVLTGLGFGLVIPPLSAAAIGSVDRESMGTAAGLLNALRMVGITLGIAALASWSLIRTVAASPSSARRLMSQVLSQWP